MESVYVVGGSLVPRPTRAWERGYVGGCNVVAIELGRYSLSVLYAETVSSAGSAWYVGSFKLCCKILLLLNVAESDKDCL